MSTHEAHPPTEPHVTKENHTVTSLRRLLTSVFSSITPFAVDGGDSDVQSARTASAGPSSRRTQGGPIASPRIPGRGREGARSPVMMGAPSRERRRFDRLFRPRTLRCAVSAAAVLVLGAAGASPATAAAPHWTIAISSAPTYFQAGDEGDYYEVIAVNDGGGATDGSPITMALTLPPGVTATAIRGETRSDTYGNVNVQPMGCTTTPVTCEANGALAPEEFVRMKVIVTVPGDASGTLTNTAAISGGGAETAQAMGSTPISSEPVPYGATPTTSLDEEGGATATQAGSHPYGFTTIIAFNVGSVSKFDRCPPGYDYGCPVLNANAKDVDVALPPGLVGNPSAVPRCKQVVFQEYGGENCPADTQVGALQLIFYGNTTAPQYVPLYNIEPPPGQPAELGFTIAGFFHIPVFFRLRSDGDYGLTARLKSLTEADPVQTAVMMVWGTPAAASHDRKRAGNPGCHGTGCESDVAPQPFLSLPTSCSGEELPIPFSGDSWQNPLDTFPLLGTTHLPAVTGCNQIDFKPSLEARPTTNVADSPSGLKVDVHVPQDHSGPEGGENPEGLATAHLKEAKVTLPKGLTVNPSSAAGLEGCSPSQVGLTSGLGATPIHMSADPANCPDGSKLGSVEVDAQLIDHPLPGAVYLAKPYDNPFKSLLALYITVNDPKTSTVVKLAGKVEVGADGQLTTTVKESPQVPFEDFKLDFFGGARAPLRTPATCGEYETTSELTPWSAPESGPPAKRSDAYQMEVGPNGHACPHTEAQQPNSPTFEAGTESPIAAAFSPFSLHLHREDGSQVFKALNVSLPPGLIGKLAGVGECSDSVLAAAAQKTGAQEQAGPSCPPSSRLGTVNVGAGAGPSPYYVSGSVYLAGPYKGAPLSIAVITPAVAGPFDLGTVVVRAALYINPETAQVSVTSDPIPTQLQGIQLDVRSIDVNLDRNQFTLNPTNCERSAVSGEEISSLGNAAQLTNPFQVGECRKLGFKPKLSLKLSGKTKRTGHPALRAVLTMPQPGPRTRRCGKNPGCRSATPPQANIARAQVTLPHSEFLDQAHIGTVCTRVQFAAGACPAASVYGHARAITPLLDQPIEGPVYLRSSSHKLPDLVAALGGQISVDLAGKVDTGKGGGIRNTFEVVPDAPVSKFVLSMRGGNKGLLVNSENLCGPHAKTKALAHFVAQNGKVYDTTPEVQNSCKKSSNKHKGHKRRGAHK